MFATARQSAHCCRMTPDRTKVARELLAFYAEAGVDGLLSEEPVNHLAPEPVPQPSSAQRTIAPLSSARPPSPARPNPGPPPPAAAPTLAPDTAVMAARDAARSAASLEDLRTIMQNFQGCALRVTATQLVFADGNPQARVMFVGEAPGRDEDLAGLPFVGRSGKLLDRMLAAIGHDRLYRQHHPVATAGQSYPDAAGEPDLPAVHPAPDRARQSGCFGVPGRPLVAGFAWFQGRHPPNARSLAQLRYRHPRNPRDGD